MLLAAIPSREGDVESATGSLLEGSHDVPALNVLDVQGVRGQDIRRCEVIDNRLTMFQTPDSPENDFPTSPVSDSAWNRVLESLTMYRELSAARIPEEFVPLRMRFQQELTFDGGIVSRFTIMFCF